MNVICFVEVNKDDGTRARIHADAIELISETKEGLTILTTRATLKVVGETMDEFWLRLRDARGGIQARVVKAPAAPAKEPKTKAKPE